MSSEDNIVSSEENITSSEEKNSKKYKPFSFAASGKNNTSSEEKIMSKEDDRYYELKEAWRILRDKYSLPLLIIIIITTFTFLFLPFAYLLIGTLMFSYFLVLNLNKLRKLKQSENLCEYKYYDLRNPISTIMTFMCSFMVLLFNVLYGLLQISLVLMLWSRLNDLHSFTDICIAYYFNYGSGNAWMHVIQKIFFIVNITVAVVPFSIFPIFWKTSLIPKPSIKPEYWISRLTKQMMIAIDKPKSYIIGCGLLISILFGVVFSFKLRPKKYCTDEKYKDAFISMMQKNGYALYILIPITIFMYGDTTLTDLMEFTKECILYIRALKQPKENIL